MDQQAISIISIYFGCKRNRNIRMIHVCMESLSVFSSTGLRRSWTSPAVRHPLGHLESFRLRSYDRWKGGRSTGPLTVVTLRFLKMVHHILPALKLTACPWKWMVGILLSYWGGLFSDSHHRFTWHLTQVSQVQVALNIEKFCKIQFSGVISLLGMVSCVFVSNMILLVTALLGVDGPNLEKVVEMGWSRHLYNRLQ